MQGITKINSLLIVMEVHKGRIFLHLEQGVADAPLFEAPRSINLETSVNSMLVPYLLFETNATSSPQCNKKTVLDKTFRRYQ